jgi:hypothetical protein
LFINGVSLAEDKISSQKTSDECVYTAFLSTVDFFLNEQANLEEGDELGQVQSMLSGGLVDDECPLLPAVDGLPERKVGLWNADLLSPSK